MGQKVNPIGIRLGIIKESNSRWFPAHNTQFASILKNDFEIRKLVKNSLVESSSISKILIERAGPSVKITIRTSKPGVIIGKKGEDIENLKKRIIGIVNNPSVIINIEEVRKPDLDSLLVATSVAQQLEKRVMFRRAMKRAVTSALKQGALGVKISVSGRLGGAEIARTEWYREGRVPLHTFRADVDYANVVAKTTYGIIGVKVWIFKGEILTQKKKEESLEEEKN